MPTIGLAALIVVASAATALAQQAAPGDPVKGRQYAASFCADCHSLDLPSPSGANTPNQTGKAPPFAAIAATSGMTEIALNAFFRQPHPSMPTLLVPPTEMRDVIAYILSLKR